MGISLIGSRWWPDLQQTSDHRLGRTLPKQPAPLVAVLVATSVEKLTSRRSGGKSVRHYPNRAGVPLTEFPILLSLQTVFHVFGNLHLLPGTVGTSINSFPSVGGWHEACCIPCRLCERHVKGREVKEVFAENPFYRIESPDESSQSLRSAIINCICPGCGGALLLSAEQFRCQGRCGADWRPVWNRMHEPGIARSHQARGRKGYQFQTETHQ